jgi:hypothetical protein
MTLMVRNWMMSMEFGLYRSNPSDGDVASDG